jgi:hypothetical protein
MGELMRSKARRWVGGLAVAQVVAGEGGQALVGGHGPGGVERFRGNALSCRGQGAGPWQPGL